MGLGVVVKGSRYLPGFSLGERRGEDNASLDGDLTRPRVEEEAIREGH
jgi:hypothetical protein